jgi:regulatory protein
MARQRWQAGGSITEPPAEAGGVSDLDADPDTAARTICLRLLTVRARTRAELAGTLHDRNVPKAAADRVLDRLAAVGLVDDRAFAARFVETRHHDRGLAARELARQLRDKGVDDEVVAEALAGVDREQELETARRLVQRKLRSMSSLEPQVQTRRLAGLLARKGYAPSTAFQVVREVLGAGSTELDDGDTGLLA